MSPVRFVFAIVSVLGVAVRVRMAFPLVVVRACVSVALVASLAVSIAVPVTMPVAVSIAMISAVVVRASASRVGRGG